MNSLLRQVRKQVMHELKRGRLCIACVVRMYAYVAACSEEEADFGFGEGRRFGCSDLSGRSVAILGRGSDYRVQHFERALFQYDELLLKSRYGFGRYGFGRYET